MTMQTNPTPDALVERVARAVAEAWRNDALPSERYSPEEVNWQDWLPEARAALDATPLAAMQERIERLEAENAKLRQDVIAFAGPWAANYAREHDLPKGHLHPAHYDILAQAGARMDDFVRADLTAREQSNVE